MKIFSGTTSQNLTEQIQSKLQKIYSDNGQDCPTLGNLKIDKFADGEAPLLTQSLYLNIFCGASLGMIDINSSEWNVGVSS